MAYCTLFSFHLSSQSVARDSEGERMEEKLERQRRSKLGGSGGIMLQKTFKFPCVSFSVDKKEG